MGAGGGGIEEYSTLQFPTMQQFCFKNLYLFKCRYRLVLKGSSIPWVYGCNLRPSFVDQMHGGSCVILCMDCVHSLPPVHEQEDAKIGIAPTYEL